MKTFLGIAGLLLLAGTAQAQPEICPGERCPVGDECWNLQFERGTCAEKAAAGVPVGASAYDAEPAEPKEVRKTCYCDTSSGSGLTGGAIGRSRTFFAGGLLGLAGCLPLFFLRRRP